MEKSDWLKRPDKCHSCGSERIICTENKIIYGSNYGDWPLIWYCYECTSLVSCHPNTTIPMGYMATQKVRQARRRAHKAFDPIHRKYKIMSRTQAYKWLSSMMNIPREKCHISMLNEEQCEQVISLSKEKIKISTKKPRTVTHIKGRKVSRKGHRRKFK